MKIKIRDGEGTRIVTEIRRPEPEAVLVLEDDKEYEVTNQELFLLVDLKYIKLKNTPIDGKQAKTVYIDSIVWEQVTEPAKEAPKKVETTIKK